MSKDAMQAASPAVTFRDKWIGSWRKRDNSSLKKSPPPPKKKDSYLIHTGVVRDADLQGFGCSLVAKTHA